MSSHAISSAKDGPTGRAQKLQLGGFAAHALCYLLPDGFPDLWRVCHFATLAAFTQDFIYVSICRGSKGQYVGQAQAMVPSYM